MSNKNYDQIDTSYTTTSGNISPGQLYYAQNITCFTELKISSSYEHTMKYGLLGLGYSRKFILSNGGRPVHY